MAHLKISPEFFKMEVREGFPVGEMMKRNWAAQLQVLEDVREMCAKHDIKWFAYAGTALGAVRHKGFIPWDDDIDICCVGEDFIKFLYYAKDELDGRYIHLSPYDRADWNLRSIARITNGDKLNFRDEHLDEWHNCPLAIGTDIFPFYYVPRDKDKQEYIVDVLLNIEALYGVNEYNVKLLREGRTEEAKQLGDVMAASIMGLQEDTGFEFTTDRTLANQLTMLYDQVCRFTTADEADYVTRYNNFILAPGWVIPKEVFDETIDLPFEMTKIPMPKDFDYFLRRQYGEGYMTPSRSGAAHDYPYFKDQIRTFQSKIELRDWVQKLHSDGTLSFPVISKQSLKETKNDRCVVLYYTSVREMIIYGEYVIDKIRDILKYFERNKDTLKLCWCPGAFLEEEADIPAFNRLVPELIEKYNALIEEYKTSGIGILDETGELKRLVESCDMFYGDSGFLSDYFGQTGKPIFIQDYHVKWMDTSDEDLAPFFTKDPVPTFDEAVYFKDGKGYAVSTNMNGLFKIDTENKTCEYLKFFTGERPNGWNLYVKIVPYKDKFVLLPGSANNLAIYDPVKNEFKQYNVYIDTMNAFCDAFKFADVVAYEGKLFLFGERYSHVLKLDPETGAIERLDTGCEETIWMRSAALREGGLVKIISSNSTELLTFNLRTEKMFVKKKYSESEMLPKLKKLADKLQTLAGKEFTPIGGFDEYRDSVFNAFIGKKGMVIDERDNWLTFADVVRYVEWKKEK